MGIERIQLEGFWCETEKEEVNMEERFWPNYHRDLLKNRWIYLKDAPILLKEGHYLRIYSNSCFIVSILFSVVVKCVLCILEAAIPVLCRSEMSSLIPEVLQTSSISSPHTHKHTLISLGSSWTQLNTSVGLDSVCGFQGIVIFIQKDSLTSKAFLFKLFNKVHLYFFIQLLQRWYSIWPKVCGHQTLHPCMTSFSKTTCEH